MIETKSHSDAGAQALLTKGYYYNLMMKMLGYDKAMGEFVKTAVTPFSGARVLDVGCGTSIILRYLNNDVEYHGFDFNPEYIAKSQKLYAERKNTHFYVGRVSERSQDEIGQFDRVCAISLLHHINDDEARQLFAMVRRVLKPGGVFVTYDPVIADGQSSLERFIMSQDRGRHIRTIDGYLELFKNSQLNVEHHVRNDLGLRIPATVMITRSSLT